MSLSRVRSRNHIASERDHNLAFCLQETIRGQDLALETITLYPFRRGPAGASQMESWLVLQRQRLEREGVKAATEKRLNFDDEAVICIGGSELSAIMRHEKAFPDASSISLNCLSDRGLEILFIGEPS